MAIVSSTTALMRYYVDGEVPKDFWERVHDLLLEDAFIEFTPDSVETISVGWVSFDDMFDYELDETRLRKPPYLAVGLRVDSRNVPAKLIKPLYEEAVKKFMQEQDRAYLSKEEKSDIKDQVKLKLLQRVLPSPQITDFLWDVDNMIVYFCSNQKRVQDIMLEIFTRTFLGWGLRLTPMYPYFMGEKQLAGKECYNRMDRLGPSRFV